MAQQNWDNQGGVGNIKDPNGELLLSNETPSAPPVNEMYTIKGYEQATFTPSKYNLDNNYPFNCYKITF